MKSEILEVIGARRGQLSLIGGAIVVALGGACASESSDELGGLERPRMVELDGGSTCTDLYAGQTMLAGRVCLAIDDAVDTSMECGPGASGAMVVTFTTSDGWELMEAHLAAGDGLIDIPTNQHGNPKIGQFPHASGPIDGATSHQFIVPLCEFGLDAADVTCVPVTAYLAAHAALRREVEQGRYETESAWADGTEFIESGSWAQYFTALLECS